MQNSLVVVVLLDIDGTLLDTNYLHVEAWAEALASVGVVVPSARIHRQIGKGTDQLLAELVRDPIASARADLLHAERFAARRPAAAPLPGARSLVATLAQRGHALWLATSAPPDELGDDLRKLDGEERIAGVVSSAEVARGKPAPDLLLRALDAAHVRARDAVAVGDSIWDLQAARAAHVRAAAVLTGGAWSRAQLEAAGAGLVEEDCAALLAAGFPERW
jgi:HAD superfamily hydrolase (TIGR01509 family)